MGMIQCIENCKFQSDGYCNLEKCGKINSPQNDCPYFTEKTKPHRKNTKLKTRNN